MRKISDDQKEIFDVVDENDRVIGKAKRGEVHQNKNLIHRSIGVVIFNRDRAMFFQKRSATKDTDPNKWTIACSGHVPSVKSYEETVHRELIEELGVDLAIEPVCKYLCRAPNETEMVMLFKASSDGPFKLSPQEIITGKFFTQKKLKEALQKQEIELSFMGRVALEKIGWLKEK